MKNSTLVEFCTHFVLQSLLRLCTVLVASNSEVFLILGKELLYVKSIFNGK